MSQFSCLPKLKKPCFSLPHLLAVSLAGTALWAPRRQEARAAVHQGCGAPIPGGAQGVVVYVTSPTDLSDQRPLLIENFNFKRTTYYGLLLLLFAYGSAFWGLWTIWYRLHLLSGSLYVVLSFVLIYYGLDLIFFGNRWWSSLW